MTLHPRPAEIDPVSALHLLRLAETRDGALPVALRRDLLRRLRRALVAAAEDLAAALARDFGARAREETLIAEIAGVLGAIDHALPRLSRWSRPERVFTGWNFLPARAWIEKRPLGVVGIIAPWNYPILLSLSPLVGALAAGCRVVLKPSEHVPETAARLATLLEELPEEVVRPVLGDAGVAAAMSGLAFDKILFTGSTATGRRVARAAAENLVPVVLELGGKSPAIIDRSADIEKAARDLIAGKLLNAGQTCVAPDHVFVPRESRDAFVAAVRTAAVALFPDAERKDYAAICRPADRARLEGLLAGEMVVPLFDPPPVAPKLTPYLVLDPSSDSPLMREEIFGPVLPVLTYESVDEVLTRLAGAPVPLALYWFGRDAAEKARVLASTRSGGVAINETILQVAVESLPFGGLGPSGMGAYHGRAGFDAFTHRRAVFEQSRFGLTRMLRPPYGDMARRILKSMIR